MPSTVAKVTKDFALGNTQGYNQGGFYAAGRFWTWYTDGTTEWLTSSPDGQTWGPPINIRPVGSGSAFSAIFDGTYLHYISTSDNRDIAYRRGTPNANGTITWSAPETILASGQGYPCGRGPVGCDQGAVAVDSKGYPWLVFSEPLNDCVACTGGWPWVSKSSVNDGRFVTDTGYPFKLNSYKTKGNPPDGEWGTILISLPGGGIFAISSYYNHITKPPIMGAQWMPGGGWSTDVPITTDSLYANTRYGSAVVFKGTIYLVFLNPAGNYVMITRDPLTGRWSAESAVQEGIGTQWPLHSPGLSVDNSGTLHLFWLDVDASGNLIVWHKTYSNGAWSSKSILLTDSPYEKSFGQKDYRNFFIFPQAYNKFIGITYEVGTESVGYQIRFATISGGPPPPPPPPPPGKRVLLIGGVVLAGLTAFFYAIRKRL